MKIDEMLKQMEDAMNAIQVLQRELDETNRGLVALNLELEHRVDKRTEKIREMETRYTCIFEMANDTIIIWDPDCRCIIDCNRRTEELLGEPRENLLRRTYRDFAPDNFLEEYEELFMEMFSSKSFQRNDLHLKRADGTICWVDISSSVYESERKMFLQTNIRDVTRRKIAEDEVKKYQEHLEDLVRERTTQLRESNKKLQKEIDERKKIEESLRESEIHINELNRELNQQVRQLEATNKELETFSYSVSHDLKSPLNIVHGMADILRETYADKLDDEGKEMLEAISQSVKKMALLIDDLLNLSRVGRKKLEEINVDIGFLVESVFDQLQVEKANRDIDLIIHKIPPAWCDERLITQVLVNLLSNAVKFTKNREKAIIEVGGCSEPGEDYNVYYVKDNGVGFKMEQAEKIFSPFQRLHSEQEYAGTGVGLAIVRNVINRHGGRTWAESSEGEGATFYFTLRAGKEE